MRTFIENYLHFIKKNCIRPPYKKLKPLKSGFIENSNFENNRDPWIGPIQRILQQGNYSQRMRRHPKLIIPQARLAQPAELPRTKMGAQNMVKWVNPEKILQNAVQTRWS